MIHGNHLVACQGVLGRFPFTPVVAACHDFSTWWDIPPRLPNIGAYVAVSHNIVERLTLENGVPPDRVRLILNAVDTARFTPGNPLPATPKRALAFAKNREHIDAIREVCRARDIAVDFIGPAVRDVVAAPETRLPRYDLVFASALSAMEAMASHRPVIVCDGRGLAGMLTLDRYAVWRPHNFGLKVLQKEITAAALHREIDLYDPAEAVRVGERLRADASLPGWIDAHIALYRDVIARHDPAAAFDARAWGLHLQTWSPRMTSLWPWIGERAHLEAELQRQAAGIDRLPLNQPLSFSANGNARDYVAALGLHPAEESGAWTASETVELRLRPPVSDTRLTIDLAYRPFLPAKGFSLATSAYINGAPLESWKDTFTGNSEPRVRRLKLPPVESDATNIWITLRTSPLRAPSDHGGSDSRRLGLNLVSLSLSDTTSRKP